MSAPLARLRAHASGPTSSGLLHGGGGVAMGAAMLSEDHAGYAFPVYEGPRAILAVAPDPITAWGVIFLALGVATLALRDRGARGALMLLAGAWATFASGALLLGVTSPDAAVAGGLAWLVIAADAARAALEHGRTHHGAEAGPPTQEG